MNGYPPPHPKWTNGAPPRAPFPFLGVAERPPQAGLELPHRLEQLLGLGLEIRDERLQGLQEALVANLEDRKSTRLNSSHMSISYAVFCLKKKKKIIIKSTNY